MCPSWKEKGRRQAATPAHRSLDALEIYGAHLAAPILLDLIGQSLVLAERIEARGLDVTPGMIQRLKAVGDGATVAILQQILAEEVAHVAAGTRWFAWCCERAGVDPADTFQRLLQQYCRGALKGPFNRRDRLAAGFTPLELDRLDALVA